MAEPVIVPVTLEVTDIDTSNFDTKDVQKSISSSMNVVRKSIEQAFSQINASNATKPLLTGVRSLENRFIQLNNAQKVFYREAAKAGKSTDEYKKLTVDMAEAKKQLDTLESARASWENASGDYIGTPQMWEHYIQSCEKYEAQLYKVQDLQAKMDDPGSFVKYADQFSQSIVESSLRKLVSVVTNFNQETEKFNQTVQDSKFSDEYAELLKQAEAYDTKLASLAEKSKKMEFTGATDTQWENLRKDAEWTQHQLEDILKQMRKVNKEGKAFRFGDGDKGEITSQIRSIGTAAGNRVKGINNRAMKNESPYTEDYQKSLDELDKLEKKIEAIKEKSAKMIELGASKKQFQSMVYDAEQLDSKVEEVKNRLTNMATEGKAFKFGTGDADAEISKISDKSNGLKSTLTGVATNAKKAQGGLTALGATHPKLAAVLGVAGKIAAGFGKVLKVAGTAASVIAKGFAGTVKVLGKVSSAVGRVASGFITVGKRIFGAIKNLNLFGKSGSKTTTDMNKRIKKLGKNILMWGFGFRTAYYAIKRLRTIFVEGFKVMGSQFDEIGQPMMRMMESFNRLKGSLATAFQPLVSVVIPILTQFMNYMSGVLESIGKFMATLTGQGHIYKAVAKDIDSVSGAAKEANKQLGSYDKLEVIGSDKGATETGYDYETQKIDATGAASKFAEMVKEAWKNADFTSVGAYVTEQLLAVLDKVEQNIIPKVTNFVNRLLKSVNTFIDGFDAVAIGDKIGSIFNTLVDGLDWEQIGMLFANLNNIVWEFLDGLANGIDWELLGQSLATGIESMFTALNLDSWVGMVSGFVNGITTAIYEVLTNVNWEEISVKLGETVNNLFTRIDIAKIGTTINTLFNTLWTIVGEFFDTVDFELIATNLATGINNIFAGDSSAFNEAMPKVASGLVTFFTTAIEQINWELIINTLLSGVLTVLQSLRDEMVKSDNPIISSFGEIIGTIIKTIDAIKPAVETIIRSIEPVVKAILPVINKLLPPIAKILATVVDIVLPPLVRLFEALMPILVRLVEAILPNIERKFTQLAKAIGVVADILTVIFVPIVDIAVGIIEGLEGTVTVFAKVFKGEIGSLKGLFTELFRVWKTPLNNIIGAFESLVNGIVKGVNIMIRALNKLEFDVPDWVPGIGGKSFGFNIKELRTISIPRLAQGAVIPPNKEFLAMLGDQKHGTNIEAPLDTIKQALAEVLAEVGGAGNKQPIVLQVNGRTLAQVVWDEQEKRYKQTGR